MYSNSSSIYPSSGYASGLFPSMNIGPQVDIAPKRSRGRPSSKKSVSMLDSSALGNSNFQAPISGALPSALTQAPIGSPSRPRNSKGQFVSQRLSGTNTGPFLGGNQPLRSPSENFPFTNRASIPMQPAVQQSPRRTSASRPVSKSMRSVRSLPALSIEDQLALDQRLKQDHITFWLPRFYEHAKFLVRDLQPRSVKDKTTLGDDYETKGIKKELKANEAAWEAVLSNKKNFVEVLQNLVQLQQRLLTGIQTNTINSHSPIALILHMLEEEDYFINVLNNRMTPIQELRFWVKEAAEHTQLAGQMVDPFNESSIETSHQTLEVANVLQQLVKQIEQGQYDLKQIQQSLLGASQGATQLLDKSDQKVVHLLIQRDMLLHEIAEATQGIKRLNYLFSSTSF